MAGPLPASAAAAAVAAIDVGSNATRLSTLTVSSTGVVLRERFVRYPVRLGHDVFAHGAVGPGARAALLAAFADIAERLRAEGIRTYRAIATSAMRDAANGPALVRAIAAQHGIHVEIIGGSAESRLARAALLRAMGSVAPDTLLLDLGGGSLELARAARPRGRSLPLGTLRLLRAHPELAQALDAATLARVDAAVTAAVRQPLRQVRPAPLAIGAGGNLEVLARLCPQPAARPPHVALARLPALAQELAPLSPAARAASLALRPDRADLVLPAALLTHALAAACGIEQLVVPGTGLREAMLRELTTPLEPGGGARRLLGQGHDHAATAARAARLGRELFVALGAVHGLWPPALAPLLTALYAWYFGAYLRADAAVRHAVYLLTEVDGLGLDGRGRAVAVHAVRQLEPQLTRPWDGDAADAHAAAVLAGLLRLTIAMAPLARRDGALHVALWDTPLAITADLSAPLAAGVLDVLAAALQRPLQVR